MIYNRTIRPKKKQLKCGHFDYDFSRGRCKQCAVYEDTLKRFAEEDEKEGGLSELIAECDELFSRYVRLKYSDKKGMAQCYTCPTKDEIKKMQCGHFISRYNMYLRFDERNVRVQCEYCNCHKHGNLYVFGKNLEAEHKGITDILYEESKTVYKYTRQELRQLIYELRRKISAINH